MSSGFDEIKRAYLAGRADGIHAASDMLGQFLSRNTDPTSSGMTPEAFVRLCEVRMDMAVRAGAVRPRGTVRVNDPDGPELMEEVATWPQPKSATDIEVRELANRSRDVRPLSEALRRAVYACPQCRVARVNGERPGDMRVLCEEHELQAAREILAPQRARSFGAMIEGAQGSLSKGVDNLGRIVDVVESFVGSGERGKGGSHE